MGLPQLVLRKWPSRMTLLRPKSAIFTARRLSSSRFSGFKSLQAAASRAGEAADKSEGEAAGEQGMVARQQGKQQAAAAGEQARQQGSSGAVAGEQKGSGAVAGRHGR